MDKIKVCHVTSLFMGGTEVFLCNLLEHTDFNKYDVTVISGSEAYSKTIVSRLKKLPVHILTCRGRNYLGKYKNLHRIFKKNSFDVCHSHLYYRNGIILLLAYYNGIPIRVSHSHVSFQPYDSTLLRFLRLLIIRPLLLQMNRFFANRYLTCSEEAASWLFNPSIINKKQHVIIPNGIDLDQFTCPNRVKHAPTEILFVGTFVYNKNPVFAVRVFFEYVKKDPSAHMTMIGHGPLRKEVHAEIERLNLSKRIYLVFETGDTPKFYQAADLLLFPSLKEGLGVVLIEAQAAGVKCLASDTVPQLAQCGLVNYKSLTDGPEAWAKYISQTIQSNSLTIDQSKLEFFDIKNTVRMLDEVYR